jgi:hypothetical protein
MFCLGTVTLSAAVLLVIGGMEKKHGPGVVAEKIMQVVLPVR